MYVLHACVVFAYVPVCVAPVCACGGQRRAWSILLYHFLPSSLEIRSPAELGARLAASKLQ